ncbi:hypothetical protein [Clostridium hydrogenum]|uniref:hypothetical protein n=1 Tax=Clostridium hydrogenum TaxID=2855764 RepID=UPI001F406AF1|nr:hypothetical protein [Clostridium hydrogenum]
MNYKDKIISEIAREECKKVSERVIKILQGMHKEMGSGDDTILKSVWEEICVQVQGEQSFTWEAYLECIREIVSDELKLCGVQIKQAIWLQTQEGIDWECDNEDEEATVAYFDDDMIEYLLNDYILTSAADWTSDTIERYLESNY